MSTRTEQMGSWSGFIIPNILGMMGVLIFLRFGVVLGTAGLCKTIIALIVSLAVCLTTSLSISALVSNGNTGSGGIYFLIKKIMGLEIASSVFFMLFVAEVLSILMEIHALCDMLYLGMNFKILFVLFFAIFSCYSIKVVLNLQFSIFLLMMASVALVCMGNMNHVPALIKGAKPFYSNGILSFSECFSILFAAFNGFETMMCLSDNLKNPSWAFKFGNIISIGFVGLIYITLILCIYTYIPADYLSANSFAVRDYALYPSVVNACVIAIILSGCLSGFVVLPRMLKSLADDKILPKFFSITRGKYQEPYIGTIIITASFIAFLFMTNFDSLLPTMSMISLFVYFVLNVVTLIIMWVSPNSWRPQWNIHYSVPLLGALFSFALMRLIDWAWMYTIFLIFIFIYLVIRMNYINKHAHGIRKTILFFFSTMFHRHMNTIKENSETWIPKILFFASSPLQYQHCIQFTSSIAKKSLFAYGTYVPEFSQNNRIEIAKKTIQEHFNKAKIDGFVEIIMGTSSTNALKSFINSSGIGDISVNTIVVHYSEYIDFLDISKYCYFRKKNLIVLFGDFNFESRPPKSYFMFWRRSAKESFNLTLSLLTQLRASHKAYKNSEIFIGAYSNYYRSVASFEIFIKKFLNKSRFKANFIRDFEQSRIIAKNSDLILFPIVPFGKKTEEFNYENEEDYRHALKMRFDYVKKFKNCMCVVAYE